MATIYRIEVDGGNGYEIYTKTLAEARENFSAKVRLNRKPSRDTVITLEKIVFTPNAETFLRHLNGDGWIEDRILIAEIRTRSVTEK